MESQLTIKNNINPELWGPYYWKVFHLTAFGYPNDPNNVDKEVYKNFYINFIKILPCEKCTQDSRKEIKNVKWDEVLQSRDSLLKWTHFFHDTVNLKLNRKTISYDNFLVNFINDLNLNLCYCDKSFETKIIFILIALIFVLIYINS